MPAQRFVGLKGSGPFDACGKLFQRLGQVAQQNSLHTQPKAMLVLCDVPTTAKENLEWAVAILMEDNNQEVATPNELEEIMVPAQARVATTMYQGDYSGLPLAWK